MVANNIFVLTVDSPGFGSLWARAKCNSKLSVFRMLCAQYCKKDKKQNLSPLFKTGRHIRVDSCKRIM